MPSRNIIHPAKRAHILGLLGAAMLIVTFGTLAMQLGNDMARHGRMDSFSARSDQFIYTMEQTVSNARRCRFAWLATHEPKELTCFRDAVGQINALASNSDYIGRIASNLSPDRRSDFSSGITFFTRPEPRDITDTAIEDNLFKIDKYLSIIASTDNEARVDRVENLIRNTNWQKRLDILGIFIGVTIMGIAGWILDRTSLAAATAEARSRNLALQLRAVLDSLTIGVAVFNTDGTLRHWNDRLATILGLPEEFLYEGLSYNELSKALTIDSRPLLEPVTSVQDALINGNDAPPVIVECRGVNGADLELCRTLYFSPADNAGHGELKGFVLTANDITLRLRTDKALGEDQKLRAVGQMTAGIAHDFKNLLTVIMGNLEILSSFKEISENENYGNYLYNTIHATRQSEILTKQLLSFTRRENISSSEICVNDVFTLISALLARVIGPNIRIDCKMPEDRVTIQANNSQLESALLNLAINARDAMPEGGTLTLEVSTKKIPQNSSGKVLSYAHSGAAIKFSENIPVTENEWVCVSIIDTGKGMTPAILDNMFEPFFTTKEKGSGTGLGMAMVASFMRQSRGTVSVCSAPGKGTEVTLWFPSEIRKITAHPYEKTPHLKRHKYNIIVSEDDPLIREVVFNILKNNGNTVTAVESAEEVIRLSENTDFRFDLLITDVQLSGAMNGISLSAMIHRKFPAMGIICMSGEFSPEMAHPADLPASVRLLPKPFRRDRLLSAVSEVMQKRREDQPRLA